MDIFVTGHYRGCMTNAVGRSDQSNSSSIRPEAERLIPTLADLSYAEISRGTGISPSMLSRMFSNIPEQKRPNPTLDTLVALRDYLQARTGTPIALDALADAIR